ncbi:hypothetical protein D0B32_26150 [Paraburkholderia sp. DHOC27]|nr:hypothetical protein D0B32_26150 [Paraburkholderia sp. DHOC27]
MGVGAVLCVLASTVAASERYVEVWNPPEARLVKPSSQARQSARSAQSRARSGKPALIARGMPKAGARRVADPLAKGTSVRHTTSEASRKAMPPSADDIPRIITPEGNVLRVSVRGANQRNAGGTAASIVR